MFYIMIATLVEGSRKMALSLVNSAIYETPCSGPPNVLIVILFGFKINKTSFMRHIYRFCLDWLTYSSCTECIREISVLLTRFMLMTFRLKAVCVNFL